MSIFHAVTPDTEQANAAGVEAQSGVRLSALGMQLEMLRLARGLSKQQLARSAGTSRQQLWRVMTGKSDLTSSLCLRLASVLDVDSRTLSTSSLARRPGTAALAPPDPAQRLRLADYFASDEGVMRTLSTLPPGPEAIPLKRAILEAVAQIARRTIGASPPWIAHVEARVASGQI